MRRDLQRAYEAAGRGFVMPVWAWVLVGLVAGYVLVQLVVLAVFGWAFMKELMRR